MTGSTRRRLAFAGQVVLTAAATYFLFRSLSVSRSELGTIDPADWTPRLGRIVASFAVLLAAFAYSVALWARLVRTFGGPRLGLLRAVAVFFIANLGRYIPGKLWQILSLAYLSGREGVSPTVASSAAVLGQLFSLGAAALLAGLAMAYGAVVGLPVDLLPWAAGLAILVGLVTTVPPLLRRILGLAFRLGRHSTPAPELDRWFGVRWTALYLPSWIGQGVAFGLLWSSFPGLAAVAWPVAVGVFAGAYFVGYAALFAPAGIGVREGALAIMLAPWLGGTQAALLAVFSRIWMTLGELIPVLGVLGGALYRWLNKTFGVRGHAV